MNRLLLAVFAVLLVVMMSVPFAGASPAGPSLNDSVARGNTALAAQLYGELGAKEGNLFFSPYSISSAMAMAKSSNDICDP